MATSPLPPPAPSPDSGEARTNAPQSGDPVGGDPVGGDPRAGGTGGGGDAWRGWWAEFLALAVGAGTHLRRRWRWYLVGTAALALAVALLFAPEAAWVPALTAAEGTPARAAAEFFDQAGEFQWFGLLVPAALLAAGFRPGGARPGWWRRAALAVLLAGVTAGVAVNVARPLCGRARPAAQLRDGLENRFYWLRAEWAYNSFPSAHAANNAATAAAVALLLPPAAVPALLFALGVAWCRLALGVHHVSDVLAGLALGLACALPWVAAMRRHPN